jgi:multidrug efflux system membrane fusion protein
MSRRMLILSSFLLFAAPATGGAAVLARSSVTAPSKPPALADAVVPVIAAAVKSSDVPIVLTGLGTVTALNTATVRSEVTGVLTDIRSRKGSSSRKVTC